LFRTGESRSSNETGLSLVGTACSPRSHDFGDAVINDFNNGRTAARIALEHDVRRFDVAMDNAARFGGSQRARNLLDNFQRERKRQWTFPADFGLECFALDQFHNVKTFTGLFAVVTDPRDVRMTNLRSRARFAQEARSRTGVLCDCSVDYFKCDDGIQHCVAGAISYRHCSSAKLGGKAIRTDFHFKVIVLERSRHQSSPGLGFVWLLAVA